MGYCEHDICINQQQYLLFFLHDQKAMNPFLDLDPIPGPKKPKFSDPYPQLSMHSSCFGVFCRYSLHSVYTIQHAAYVTHEKVQTKDFKFAQQSFVFLDRAQCVYFVKNSRVR